MECIQFSTTTNPLPTINGSRHHMSRLLGTLRFSLTGQIRMLPIPIFLPEPFDSSFSEPGLSAVLKTGRCLFGFLTFFSIIAILDLHFKCPLLLSTPELDCTHNLVDFFHPFILLHALSNLSFLFLFIVYHSFESH